MTEIYRTEDTRTDSLERHNNRHPSYNRNQPYFTAPDLAMGVAICLMIWGRLQPVPLHPTEP